MHCFTDLTAHDSPAAALESIIMRTGYIAYLKADNELPEAESRIANVNELINAIKHMESLNNKLSIAQLLDEIALMQEKASHTQNDQTAVTLMTLHAAKGLEFDLVIIAGIEEGILPSTRALNDTDALEEERRLLYVGITRARERLILSNSRYRYTYGRMTDQMPSRFLQDIASNILTTYDARNKESAMQRYFAQWLGIATAEPEVITFAQVSKKQMPTPHPEKVSRSTVTQTTQYRIHQAVQHAKYGIGTIQKIEPQLNGSVYITAQFKSGIKKILDSFLQKI